MKEEQWQQQSSLHQPFCVPNLCENLLTHSMAISSIKSNLLNHDGNGLIRLGGYCIQVTRKEESSASASASAPTQSQFHVIICHLFDHKMAVLTANSLGDNLQEIDMTGYVDNAVIDLARSGRRWEGGMLNNLPFGYGCEYSDNDNLIYQGFRMGSMNVCYGTEYRDSSVSNQRLFSGHFFNGKRHSLGVMYDLQGEVDYEGEWSDNNTVKTESIDILTCIPGGDEIVLSIEQLVIGSNIGNTDKIPLLRISPFFSHLKSIHIGANSFKQTHGFVLDGLVALEEVICDYGSFLALESKDSKSK